MSKYSTTIQYLYTQLPMYHRIGPAAYKANLDNITFIAETLGNPERKFKSVHIAGTNGKGSVSNMLASVFQEAGYKTGLFTSPHLKDFRERIRIDGIPVPENAVTDFVNKYKDSFDKIQPSFFEWSTALAFFYFANEKVDIAIIETGLGGRLDSTNIITPLLSVITNISYDHVQLLGNTLDKIAIEKAGIIKRNVPVIIGERQNEIDEVFVKQSKSLQSPLYFADQNYTAEWGGDVNNIRSLTVKSVTSAKAFHFNPDLQGEYQEKNICTVLQCIEILNQSFPRLGEGTVTSGLANVRKNTGLSGRWQVLKKKPLTIADVAHNPAGIKSILGQINSLQFDKLHFIIGMVNDKDISGVLELLPITAQYYFCKADIPRALDENELKTLSSKYNLQGNTFKSVAEAYHAAQKNAVDNDLIFIGGSIFTVAEIL